MRPLLLCLLTFVLATPTPSHTHAQNKKKTVAVLEFNSSSREIGKDELITLSNRFRSILVKTNAFTVLERGKMSDILKEQNFVMSDNCNSSECAIQVGQLLGVEIMVAGDIGKLGNTYSVDLRIIDVSTGQILLSETRDHEGKIDGLFSAMTDVGNAFAGIKAPDEPKNSGSGSFTDPRDGKKYKTVKIGLQTWMAENLNYRTDSSWCYDNEASTCEKYGRLYDWEHAKIVAPPGWHLPTQQEWEMLLNNYGGPGREAFDALIEEGKSGFDILLGGSRGSLGNFDGVGWYAGIWLWDNAGPERGWVLEVHGSERSLGLFSDNNEYSSYYVRCVKD